MEVKYLESFVFVAETKSFSIASARCHVTQPAISHHIKALEDELGCKLLIRTTHSITLTESGKELLPRAKDIIKRTEECKDSINALNNNITGELRIGIGSFITPYIRKAALTFLKRYPNVRLCPEFGKACHLNQMLRKHDLDIAFTMNTAYKDEGIESQECIPFSICAFMSNTHPLASQEKVTFEELLTHQIIMPDVGEREFSTFQKYMNRDLSGLNVRCIISNPDEALAILEESKMITFATKLYMKDYPHLAARPIVGLEQQLMSNAHWMQDVPLKKSAQLFMDIVREEAVPYLTALQEQI
ncbi:MAG: LysR family transcriptional regulator [Prevotella sp.]|nr:LysR family transcriptional regulator [Candidatus Prevotella equi]